MPPGPLTRLLSAIVRVVADRFGVLCTLEVFAIGAGSEDAASPD